MCPRRVQEAQATSSWAATKDQWVDRRQGKRTLEDAPGRDDTFDLAARRPASISIANPGASLKGKGLRCREGAGVRTVRADARQRNFLVCTRSRLVRAALRRRSRRRVCCPWPPV